MRCRPDQRRPSGHSARNPFSIQISCGFWEGPRKPRPEESCLRVPQPKNDPESRFLPLSFVVAGFILCVASVRSYPFLAHRSIGWALSLLFIALGIPVVIAFAQIDKDAILSRLSDTQPGKLDRAFYVRLVSYGALPLLTVLASQFPPIGRFLFSWVQPAIEALH